ncbi:MAG: 50S ribosomal protein L3 [Candidatus Moranbacteria bacterium]|nr:50S ribosomal protein L3 [Candidatus Moranbacteria bacterium]
MKFLIGKKLGMTTLFDETKGALNVTLIVCDQNTVTSHRTMEKDGYMAVQVETQKTKKKSVRKEFRFDKGIAAGEDRTTLLKELEQYTVGAPLDVASFLVGERVHITGVTKAKGFQGVVKRHGFGGAPASHGRKHDMRKPGSIGPTFPEHVIKGRRMAGRMGGVNMTVRNLSIAYVNKEEGIIAVRGAVPGVNGRLLTIVSAK